MISEEHVGTRVKDSAGHFGQLLAFRQQLRCGRGDAGLVRWESITLGHSWRYSSELEPARSFSARPGARLETA